MNTPERASTASAITDEQTEEGREAIDYLHRHGFRKCDIAACNCGSWHGGDASNRLSEISYALSGVGLGNRGKTLVQEIELLIEEHEAALASNPPAPAAPSEDTVRLDYLQSNIATVEIVPGMGSFYPMRFRIGGLHVAVNNDIRAAIDAALAASTKGEAS